MNATTAKVNFYRLLTVFVTLLLLMTVAKNLSWASPLAQTVSDIDRVKQRGKLIVAIFFGDVPPFFMHNQQRKFVGSMSN
jgi:hypothetical protein